MASATSSLNVFGGTGIPTVSILAANLCNACHTDLQKGWRSTYKFVTSSVYGEDESRFVGFGFDLLPQMDNMGINRSGRRKAVIPPNFLEQAIATQCLSLMA